MDSASVSSRPQASSAPDIAVSLGLIALAFLPLLAGGFSGWGYLIAHLLLPLSAALCLLLRPPDTRRYWALAGILIAGLGLIYIPTVEQGQVLSLYILVFPCAWIVADTALHFSPQRSELLLPLMTGSATFCAFYGLLDWLDARAADYQVTSFFGLHNSFAGFMLLAWPLGLMLASRARQGAGRLLGIAASLLMLAALVLTYSRAAWVMFFLQLLFIILAMLWSGRRNYGRQIIYGLAGIAVVLGGLLALAPVRSVLARVTDFSGYSFQGRLRFWEAAWQIFRDHPLHGIGLGNFAYVYPQYQKDYIYYSVDPHCWVLQLCCELGLPGLLAAILLLLGFILWAARVLQGKALPLPWRVCLVAAVGGSLAHAAVDFDYTFSATNAFLGALLAMGSFAALQPASAVAVEAGQLKLSRWLQFSCGLLILGSLLRAPYLCMERFVLDSLRGMTVETPEKQAAKLELLNMAIRYNPSNQITRYQRASMEAETGPVGDESARADLTEALRINPRAANALFLKGMLNPAHEAGSRDVEQAIALDPYNFPDHYYGWATLTDDPAEQLRRLELGMERIPITEPVTPQHVRPGFYPLNGLFTQWYEKMMKLTDDKDKQALYRSRAAEFRRYYENNQYQPKIEEPNI